MYRLAILFTLILFAGCSSEITVTRPDGVSDKFYKESVALVNILDKHFREVQDLTPQEEQRFKLYLNDFPADTKQEREIQQAVLLLQASQGVNTISMNHKSTDGTSTSYNTFMEEIKKVKQKLNIS